MPKRDDAGMWTVRLLTLGGLISLCGTMTHAAEPQPSREALDFFERRIRPVLVEHCYRCHAEDAKIVRAGLVVDSRVGLIAGGESGPAIVPGKPDESLLMEALRFESYEMPPTGKLPESVIADFETWIAMGAPDPRLPKGDPASRSGASERPRGEDHWAFAPVDPGPLPDVSSSHWPHSEIDAFVLAGLGEAELSPASDAEPEVLLRRLYFDLIGLPPSPEELAAFRRDAGPEAVARVVDELLASSHFGERWGRHWLDVARYSDSTGGGRSLLFRESWRYRDYVIEAFNADLPFNRFVIEQIAGDLLPEASSIAERRAALVATGFLALGPTNYELQDKSQLEMDVIDEQIDTIGRAFLGMTIGCARCHDHKFDPVSAEEYYALAGIFKSTQTLVHSNVSKWVEQEIPVSEEERARREAFAAREKELKARVETLGQRLQALLDGGDAVTVDDEQAELVGAWNSSMYSQPFLGAGYRTSRDQTASATFRAMLEPGTYEVQIGYSPAANRSPAVPVEVRHVEGVAEHVIDQRSFPQEGRAYHSVGRYSFAGEGVVVLNVRGTKGYVIVDHVRFVRTDGDADPQLARQKQMAEEELASVQAELKRHEAQRPAPLPKVISVADVAEPADIPVAVRGNVHHPGDVVPRGAVAIMGQADLAIADGESGRLELARWIAREDHPLTARVIVNRVWSHLFGAGLVRTVDNFGLMGEEPSHPELLDWLARQFVEDGWSIKRLVRRIVLSRTYQMSSVPSAEARKIDPQNRLLSHQNRRRLEAESLLDAMLVAAGRLDRTMGGNSVPAETRSEYRYPFTYERRSVYLPVFRNEIPGILSEFDFPDPNLSVGRRVVSTRSTQALLMMNSPLVQSLAAETAARVVENSDDPVGRLYHIALNRDPSDAERHVSEAFLGDLAERDEQARLARWSALCHALFASVDYRFLD